MGPVNRILSLFSGYNWVILPASVFAVVFHEIAHGLVANLLGDKTAESRGRLSINPLNHIDIVGFLCMVFFGYGWAKPVPINPYYFKHKKTGIVLVSLAGPVSNFIMAFISLFLGYIVVVFFTPINSILITVKAVFSEFFLSAAALNIGLAVFNLIPIPPLDGSKILFSFLPNSAYGFILQYERFGIIALLVLMNLPFFDNALSSVIESIYMAILNLIYAIF